MDLARICVALALCALATTACAPIEDPAPEETLASHAFELTDDTGEDTRAEERGRQQGDRVEGWTCYTCTAPAPSPQLVWGQVSAGFGAVSVAEAQADLAEYISSQMQDTDVPSWVTQWPWYLQGQSPEQYVATEASCAYTAVNLHYQDRPCERPLAPVGPPDELHDDNWRCFTCTVRPPWGGELSAGLHSVNQSGAKAQLIAQLAALGFDDIDWPPQQDPHMDSAEWVAAYGSCAYTPVNVSGRVCQLEAAGLVRVR